MAKRKRGGLSSNHVNSRNFVSPKNEEQKNVLDTINDNIITFVKGAPGSGKTFLAVSHALEKLEKGEFDRIVLTRPVVEAAGERLGFLPGDMNDKINPYMIPIFETLSQLIRDENKIQKMFAKNGSEAQVRVLPLAYMRGCTFVNSFVICDEMQNSTPEQVRMLLTRIGEGSKMVLCGDILQSDIDSTNGLEDAFDLLHDIEDVGFATLTEKAIVRHPIIAAIEERYQRRHSKRCV